MELNTRQAKHSAAFLAAVEGFTTTVVAKSAELQTPGIRWGGVKREDLAAYYATAMVPTEGRAPVFRSLRRLDLVQLRRDCATRPGVPYVEVKTPGQVYFESWGFEQSWSDVMPAERRHYERTAREQAGKAPLNFLAPEQMNPDFEGRVTARSGQPFPEAAKRVALHLWRAAGEPEKDSEPTSVGRAYYEDRAAEVLRGLAELGYRVTRPSAARKQKRA